MRIFDEIKKELGEQMKIDETYVESEFDEFQSKNDKLGFIQDFITI